MASRNPFGPLPDKALDQVSLRFLSKEATGGLFHWPQDLKEQREQAQVSSLLEPQIFNIYQKEVQEAGYL